MPFDYFCMVRIDEKFDTLGLKTLKSDLPIYDVRLRGSFSSTITISMIFITIVL